jgi:hypothetical protein
MKHIPALALAALAFDASAIVTRRDVPDAKDRS